MNQEIIDLSSSPEPEGCSGHPDRIPKLPSTARPLTPFSEHTENWPEDELNIPKAVFVNMTRSPRSIIIVPDGPSDEESESTARIPNDYPSPSTSDKEIANDFHRSEEQGFAQRHPSFKSIHHLYRVRDAGCSSDSQSSGSTTLETGSFQSESDHTEITMPGSSPRNPIDLSDIEEDLPNRGVQTRLGLAPLTCPRRPIAIPRTTLADEIDETEYNGSIIRSSSTVKLANGMFLRVERITQREGQVHLWGRQLVGCNDNLWPPFVPRDEHELVWLPRMDHETDLISIETHLPVSLMEVTGLCKVIFTNKRRGANHQHPPNAGLFCRFKVTARKRPSISPHRHCGLQPGSRPQFDMSIEYLTVDECDEGHGLESHVLRNLYRGCETVPFGESEKRQASQFTDADDREDGSSPIIDLTVEPTGYSFGDAYCGAGGTSCGAKQAGVQIKWACDMDPNAVETYALNFEDVWIEFCSFNDLLTHSDRELRVDITHCSPPCQTFSPAHTVNCSRDDQNSACIFSAANLVDRAHPRVITMEETWGLVERYETILNRVIMDLFERGFSARWAVIDVLHYGVPQTRKRLIIIGAGPGETLPPFPAITHDLPGSGCKPVITIDDAINEIPDHAPNHDVENCLRRWALQWRDPYDGRMPAKTLTCSGGEGNYHPSGRRQFTEREVACLQTFPMDFQFSERNVRKQVGNAVPPALAKAIYQEIIASLRETDSRERDLGLAREREWWPLRLG